MITLRSSTSDGSTFQVYDGDELIGNIIRYRGSSGDRYVASIERYGKEEFSEKEFDASHQALKWIEENRS